MKSKFTLLLILASVLLLSGSFIIVQSDGNDKKSKINKKYNKIRQEQIKRKTYSYFKGGTLHVFDSNNIFVKNLKLYDTDTNTYFYRSGNNEIKDAVVWDTLCTVVQDQDSKYLFVYLCSMGFGPSQYASLLDLKSKKIIVDFKSVGFCDSIRNFINYSIPGNVGYIGSSKDDKYHMFVGGTSASYWGFYVYDNYNKVLKSGGYFEIEGSLKWMKNNSFYYWELNQDTIVENMPKINVQNDEYYMQKKYWVNGKDSLTKEYKIGRGW